MVTYPHTDEHGVLHMSRHVEVYFDIEDIRADLETSEWETDSEYGDGREVRRCYLGSWLSLSPSGKIYAPFACSNVDECPACHGSGDVPNPRKARLRKKYRNKAAKLRGWLLRYHGSFMGGTWPDHLTRRLKRWDELGRETLTCPRCEGLGSAEAHDDELFTEGLELFVENEHDLYIEQDSGDIFVVQYREQDNDAYDEEPDEPFTDGPLKGKTVRVKGEVGVAWYVVADDGETWATAVMVGDDTKHRVDRDDCVEISEDDYCAECGQIGCGHDGRSRGED